VVDWDKTTVLQAFFEGFWKVRVFCVVVCGEFVVGCMANVVA